MIQQGINRFDSLEAEHEFHEVEGQGEVRPENEEAFQQAQIVYQREGDGNPKRKEKDVFSW